MVAKSLVQSGGQLDFESCGASIEAGVLHLQQDLNQTAGSMSFKGGFAAARGGCAIIENRFWQMGGSMLFSNCTSQKPRWRHPRWSSWFWRAEGIRQADLPWLQ